MALTDEGGMNTTMLVSPTGGYGNNGGFGFGDGNGWWIILLLLLVGWGNNGNGWGGNGGGFYPYAVNTGNEVQRGFDQSAIMGGISGINAGINGIQNSLCNGFAGVNQTVANGFAQAEIANNARQMANMQQAFAMQSQFADCCCENRLANCQTQNIIQSEGSATRFADANNTRDLLTNQTANTQAILDKLCQLELDGVKAQVEAKNDRIAELQTQLNIANLAASQTAQTAQIQKGQLDATAALVNELRSCPVPSMPVYGMTPIFSCPNNNNSGCGCGCNG